MLGLGLGLTNYVVPVLYGASFIVAFFSAFYRSAIGILFLSPLLPIYIVVHKILKSGYFFANNVTDMLIVAMLLGWFLQKGRDDGTPLKHSPLLIPILIFMGYNLFGYLLGTATLGADLFSELAEQRLADWKNYMILPLLYLITYYTLRERKWKYALFILLFFSFILMTLKFRKDFMMVRRTHFMYSSQLGGTFAFLNANAWGSFHAIYTLFAIGLALIDKHVKRRIAYAIVIIGGIYSLMYSYSRGAYVGFLAGFLAIALLKKRILLVPLFLFLIVWKSVLPLSVVERVEMTFIDEAKGVDIEKAKETDAMTVGGTHLSTAGRKRLWDEALEYFRESPIFGTGFRTYGKLTGMDTHNEYLKMLAEGGIIGLFIYLWFYYLALRSGWRLYKNADENLLKAFGFGFFCAVIGSIVVNFFGDRWSYLQIGGLYWIFWALVDQEYSMLKAKEAGANA